MIVHYIADEVRVPCVKAGLIGLALDSLDIHDPGVVLHALRSLGNICCDNGKSCCPSHLPFLYSVLVATMKIECTPFRFKLLPFFKL